MKIAKNTVFTALITVMIFCAVTAMGQTGKVLVVPPGRKAVIRTVSTGSNSGFEIINKDKGWTVYRSWGDNKAVSGLILAPGRYEFKADDNKTVKYEYEMLKK